MSIYLNFQLRGACVVPQPKETVHYYLILMDVPLGVSTSDFSMVDDDDLTTLKYNYSGDFSTWETLEQTINLPMYTNKPVDHNPTALIVTDSKGNQASGQPNKGQPPIIPLYVTRENDSLVVSQQFRSITIPNNTFYFLVAMGSTFPEGNYLAPFGQMVGESSSGTNVLKCYMQYAPGTEPLAMVGVVPIPSLCYYQYTQGVSETGLGPTLLVLESCYTL